MRRPTLRTLNRTPADHSGMGYHAGLDGIRALAIVAVLLYHGGVVWAAGGFLGVEAFFVLSGFLITSLLIAEWRQSATISLTAFWARRARRLLPALFCLVAAVGLYEAFASSTDLVPDLKGDGIATLFYFGNWHEIATQSNYFAATGPASPLQHTWSLAIEEQFYIVWPISLLVASIRLLASHPAREPTDRPARVGDAPRRERDPRARLGGRGPDPGPRRRRREPGVLRDGHASGQPAHGRVLGLRARAPAPG